MRTERIGTVKQDEPVTRLLEGLRLHTNLLHPHGSRSPVLTLRYIKFRKGKAATCNQLGFEEDGALWIQHKWSPQEFKIDRKEKYQTSAGKAIRSSTCFQKSRITSRA